LLSSACFFAGERSRALAALGKDVGHQNDHALYFADVAESRLLWSFPETLGLYVLDVPLENILITLPRP
jgi:hypothetical protein